MNAAPASSPASRPSRARRPVGWRHRLAVASRVLAAAGGGYALAAFFTTTVALLVRTPREEAAMLAAVPSFLVLAGAVIWAFIARTALRAWLGIGLPALVLAGLTWWLAHRPAP